MPSDAASSYASALVLVVDKDGDTRDLYAVLLQMDGLQVEQAKDRREAFAKACVMRPAAIITDLMLEQCDGLTLADCLGAHDETRDIPVIVVTGYTSPKLQPRIRNLHARAVLLKPCSLDRLREEVRRAIAGVPEPAA